MLSLEQLLASRDARAAFQRQLLEAYPSCTLVCLTVQLPGPQKRTDASLLIGEAGQKALQDRFSGERVYSEVRDLETGYEAYFLLRRDALETKRICCELEESHPLGRLMDIDVMPGTSGRAGGDVVPGTPGRAGGDVVPGTSSVMPGTPSVMPGLTGHPTPVSREEIGLPPRKCLLCEQPARYCMRAHTHTTAALLLKIEQMVADFKKRL